MASFSFCLFLALHSLAAIPAIFLNAFPFPVLPAGVQSVLEVLQHLDWLHCMVGKFPFSPPHNGHSACMTL